jgi:rhodanese-related sulfurtransferase
MDRRYTILAILVIVAAFGLLILPEKGGSKEADPTKMLISVNDHARFLSTDLITERIIEADPTLQLIDVRPAAEFRVFALQGAVNIPLDSLLSPQWKDIINENAKDKVFYSNGSIESDLAWQICTRLQVPRVFVMEGGLNRWFETIIKGVEPSVTASSKEHDLYSFRLAARQYFIGVDVKKEAPAKATSPKEKVKVVKQAPEPAAGGGC